MNLNSPLRGIAEKSTPLLVWRKAMCSSIQITRTPESVFASHNAVLPFILSCPIVLSLVKAITQGTAQHQLRRKINGLNLNSPLRGIAEKSNKGDDDLFKKTLLRY